MYKRILISDDSETDIKQLKKFFIEKGLDVEYADNPEATYQVIQKREIDILILDWYFTIPRSPDLAIEVINCLIANKYFIPIFIYSNAILSKEELDHYLPNNYPRSLVKTMTKPVPSKPQDTKDVIDKWYRDNSTVRLAKEWYESIDLAVRNTMEEMYFRIGDGVIALLQQTYSTEKETGEIDIISLIMSILQHHLLQNNKLVDELGTIIKSLNTNPEAIDYKNYEKIRSFEMYSFINETVPIGTGDVFLLSDDILHKETACSTCIMNKDWPTFAVAISAECDYARSNKNLRYHKFIIGKGLDEVCKANISPPDVGKIKEYIGELCSHKFEGLYYLPFVPLNKDGSTFFENIVLDFQNVVAISKSDYDEVLLQKRIGRLRPIYYQHLLRRYSSFSSRIGVPDIPRLKRVELAQTIFTRLISQERSKSS